MNLAAGDDRNRLVEEVDERPQNPALGLPAQTEQDEIVPGEHRVDDLRHHRVVEADDAGEERRPRAEPVDQVAADLVLDAAARKPPAGNVGAELAERARP